MILKIFSGWGDCESEEEADRLITEWCKGNNIDPNDQTCRERLRKRIKFRSQNSGGSSAEKQERTRQAWEDAIRRYQKK